FPAAMAAATSSGRRRRTALGCVLRVFPRSGRGGPVNRVVDASLLLVRSGTRVLGWVSPRPISTRPLNPLRGVHAGPINPMVCGGPYPIDVGGRPHLEAGFPLRCFQRL